MKLVPSLKKSPVMDQYTLIYSLDKVSSMPVDIQNCSIMVQFYYLVFQLWMAM